MSLHNYCASCDIEGVKHLLAAGQDINTVDEQGFTMLHILASKAVTDPTEIAEHVVFPTSYYT